MRCTAGHESLTDDYCSVCGVPIDAAASRTEPVAKKTSGVMPPAPVVPPASSAQQSCPVCHAVAAADAFFCETCGYDFLTGALPRGIGGQVAENSGSAAPATSPEYFDLGATSSHTQPESPLIIDQGPVASPHPVAPSPGISEALNLGGEGADLPGPDSLRPPEMPSRANQGTYQPQLATGSTTEPRSAIPAQGGPARWVAEIWIDPEWYRIQQAPEQLPSPGQPIIKALRLPRIIIGRASADARPELDCNGDTGVSRRQAALTTDGVRWFVEDLGSSNGTYLGRIDRPLPIDPLTRRTELGHHDRIYVGSWTRIVVRPALLQEADL